MKKSLSKNLLNSYPPFQIEANLGLTAGICEMLIQSHSEYIHLLPAIPYKWKSGEIKGFCARGGFEISFRWKKTIIEELNIKSILGNKCIIRTSTPIFNVENEKIYSKLDADGLYTVEFKTQPEQKYLFMRKLKDLIKKEIA